MIPKDERQANRREPDTRAIVAEAPTRVYHADGIAVEWYADRCIGSGRCVRALPRVFDPARRPWIDVSAADEDAIARAVLGCPSGALQLGGRPPTTVGRETPGDAAAGRPERIDDDA